MIDILVLTADDWKLWRELRLSALTDAPYAFGSRLEDWQGDGDQENRWRDRLSIPGSHNLIATLDGQPIGMASGIPGPQPDTVELISMWIDRSARGLGAGDRLVQEIERWSVEAGAEILQLAVTPGNEPAIALYRRNGFGDTEQLGDLMADGRRETVMAKTLSTVS